jgi:hypothetical protein
MVNPYRFYTYAYLRKDKTPYYIGKGSGRRLCKKHNGFNPPEKYRIVLLKQNLTEEEAFKHEKYMIFVFGRKDLGTGILHNKTDGGEGICGYKFTDESRQKMKNQKVNKKWSNYRKKKWSNILKGRKKDETHKNNIKKSVLEAKTKKHQELYLIENNLGFSVKEINTLRGICRKYNIDVGYASKMLKGERKTYKGWTVKKLDQNT